MVKEFKDFSMKGNVVDMAVGIIIGGAFGTIVKSLVSDVIMPPIGLLMGGIDFSELAINLQDKVMDGDTVTQEAVAINYGMFLNNVFSFLIVAFAVFMMIKAINAAKKKEEEQPAEPPKPSDEVVLLTEIRDALQSNG
jgi:large conductance mechanosensitive channel